MAPKLTYTTLDHSAREIRVLQLLPSDSDDAPLECNFMIVSLLDEPTPRYEALSYRWGDDTPFETVLVDGQSTVPHQNLVVALQHLRQRHGRVALWADALCINQADETEKAHQVGIMGLIFSMAHSVIAWLGPASPNSELAMDMLEVWADFHDSPRPQQENLLLAAQAAIPQVFTEGAKTALHDLYTRDYWTRLWIAQEIWLAKEMRVHCGGRAMDLKRFESAHMMRWLTEIFEQYEPNTQRLVPWSAPKTLLLPASKILQTFGISKDVGVHGERMLPLDTVQHAADLGCFDPRDKIFGLLSLVNPDSAGYDLIRADYGASNTVERVYRNFAEYCIRRRQTLEVLEACARQRSKGPRAERVPSWVPDWRNGSPAKVSRIGKQDPEPCDTIHDFVRFAGDVLFVKGEEVDTVAEVYENGLFPFWQKGEERSSDFGIFWNEIVGRSFMGNTGIPMLQQYYQLLSAFEYATKALDDLPPSEKYLRGAARFLRFLFLEIDRQKVKVSVVEHAEEMDTKELENQESNHEEEERKDPKPIEGGHKKADTEELEHKDSDPVEADHKEPEDSNPKYTGLVLIALFAAFFGPKGSQEQRDELQQLCLEPASAPDGLAEGSLPNTVDGYLPFKTSSGNLGLAHIGVEEGDKICRLAPHGMLFLLRPDNELYLNMGRCHANHATSPDDVGDSGAAEEKVHPLMEFGIH